MENLFLRPRFSTTNFGMRGGDRRNLNPAVSLGFAGFLMSTLRRAMKSSHDNHLLCSSIGSRQKNRQNAPCSNHSATICDRFASSVNRYCSLSIQRPLDGICGLKVEADTVSCSPSITSIAETRNSHADSGCSSSFAKIAVPAFTTSKYTSKACCLSDRFVSFMSTVSRMSSKKLNAFNRASFGNSDICRYNVA